MGQLELNLEHDDEYSLLSQDELEELYKQKVGVDPRFRLLDREKMIAGIQDPEKERDRLAALDREEDRAELKKNYRR